MKSFAGPGNLKSLELKDNKLSHFDFATLNTVFKYCIDFCSLLSHFIVISNDNPNLMFQIKQKS